MALHELEELIRRAFDEDSAYADATSIACISEGEVGLGRVVLKQNGCIAGLVFLPWIFELLDPRLKTHLYVREGTYSEKGTVLARIEGPARSLLAAERVALNFLQHLSGVATLTAKCLEQVKATKCKILDTRKTLLGLRSLQKYAVRVGGGTNHRLHLGDQILIKNNHLALAARSHASPLSACLKLAKQKHPFGRIEVEIGSTSELETAIEAGADAILLDNMSVEEIAHCVRVNQNRVFLEASGGMTLETIKKYAETGVDAISIGALTHSAPALDISLRIE
ncbi:MAG: carboxylating nicotinate-nucleotide diphosphorylase [Verrucomicrobia bacterium]|nr:carboxylating nicotinate-nucleotide diphosphorylase [Verrucomicrobiota bacterium]